MAGVHHRHDPCGPGCQVQILDLEEKILSITPSPFTSSYHVTEFALDIVTPLRGIDRSRYAATSLKIEIHVLGVNTSILGVYIQDGTGISSGCVTRLAG